MSITTQVEARDGRPVVVKRADGPSVAGLEAEARRLRQSTHPGVAAVVACGPVGDGFELQLVHAGRPLGALPPLTASEVACAMACVATTLADLHDLGIVHGRIEASHVLVGSDGRAVLCGLGPGTQEPPPTPADDVHALGVLLTDLLGTTVELEPIPDRRWRVRLPRADWERRALLSVADLACADVPTRRPTARRLAASLASATPGAVGLAPAAERSPGTHADDPLDRLRASAPEPSSGPWRSRLLGMAGLMALVVAVVRSAGLEAPMTSSRPTPSAPASTTMVPAEESDAPDGSDEVEVEVEVVGRVLTVDGERFEVGQPGDTVAVGDWDCDGTITPAVLRPSSSEVFVFGTWGDGAPVEVGPVRRVAGAVSLVVTEHSGCATLAVRTDADELVEIVAAGSS